MIPDEGLVAYMRERRLPGESLIDTARRMLLVEALDHAAWHQADAAEALGLTRREITYAVRHYIPKDRIPREALDNWRSSDWNPHGPQEKEAP